MKVRPEEIDDLEDAPRGTFRSRADMEDDEDDAEVQAMKQLAAAAHSLAAVGKALAQPRAATPAPIVNVPAPQVTVMPSDHDPCCWTAEVTDRDERGFIKKVSFTPSAAR